MDAVLHTEIKNEAALNGYGTGFECIKVLDFIIEVVEEAREVDNWK